MQVNNLDFVKEVIKNVDMIIDRWYINKVASDGNDK